MFKILIVDDEPDLELLLRQKFRKRISAGELQLFFALNGEEALLSLAADDEIEIVVSDINMPVMDGLTLLSRVREINRLIKVIIVSAYDDLKNIRTAMNRGAYDFLTKPLDLGDLETTLAKTDEEIRFIRQGLQAQDELRALEYELKLATRIQQSILPETLSGHGKFEISATMLPAKEVGGDFYDFFLIDASTLGIAIGDVSGKGIPAALFMAVTRTLLRGVGLQAFSPAECLERVNRLLMKQSTGEIFVTLFYAVLNLESGRMEFAKAAQTPPYLLSREGKPQLLKEPNGMIVGMFEEAQYENGHVDLQPGSLVVLYTDGVTEAESANGEFFSSDRFTQVLETLRARPAEEIVIEATNAVRLFANGSSQSDDITVVALRWGV